MNITLPYRFGDIQVEVPEARVVDVIQPEPASAVPLEESLGNELEGSQGDLSFGSFLQDGTLFLVNDATRPTPTSSVLNYLDRQYDLQDLNVEFLVATGAHRPPTKEESTSIFGGLLDEVSEQVYYHDSTDSSCSYIGKSSYGNEIFLNQRILDAPNLVVITSVEPHYFAGFTGGRKSILPGVSAYQTIENNHSLYHRSGAKVLNLDGNPIHQEMVEILDFLDKDIYAFNLVLNRDQQPAFIFVGGLEGSFRAAVNKAREIFTVELDERPDIVVTVAVDPMDVNLYQAQKALEHGKQPLKTGGKIVLVSACTSGVGDGTFINLLSSSSVPEEVRDKVQREYKLGYHKAARIAELAEDAQIYAFTDLSDDLLRKAFVTPLANIQQFVVQETRADKKFLFLLDGTVTVPRFK